MAEIPEIIICDTCPDAERVRALPILLELSGEFNQAMWQLKDVTDVVIGAARDEIAGLSESEVDTREIAAIDQIYAAATDTILSTLVGTQNSDVTVVDAMAATDEIKCINNSRTCPKLEAVKPALLAVISIMEVFEEKIDTSPFGKDPEETINRYLKD